MRDPPSGGDCEDGKPQALVFEYTNGDCSASDNDQGGSDECDDHAPLTEPVEVIYVGKDPEDFTVAPAGEIVFFGGQVAVAATGADRLKSNTELEIRSGSSLLQELKIHTSCSKPINVGDQFGSLILTQFIPESD